MSYQEHHDCLVGRGLYALHLTYWRDAYGEDAIRGKQLLTIKQDSMKPTEDGSIDFQNVIDFIGKNDIGLLQAEKVYTHTETYKGILSDKVQAELNPYSSEVLGEGCGAGMG